MCKQSLRWSWSTPTVSSAAVRCVPTATSAPVAPCAGSWQGGGQGRGERRGRGRACVLARPALLKSLALPLPRPSLCVARLAARACWPLCRRAARPRRLPAFLRPVPRSPPSPVLRTHSTFPSLTNHTFHRGSSALLWPPPPITQRSPISPSFASQHLDSVHRLRALVTPIWGPPMPLSTGQPR